jgi:CheY-like chemotaxis protein
MSEDVLLRRPPVVLSVEDHPAALYARDRILRQKGFTVANATSGKAALELAERLRPDLILLDIVLPDIDGREVCRQLKANPDLRDIPVVLISASVTGHAQQLEGMLWGGADAFVVEPADPETLESTIRKVLRSHWPAGLATLVPPRDPAS